MQEHAEAWGRKGACVSRFKTKIQEIEIKFHGG